LIVRRDEDIINQITLIMMDFSYCNNLRINKYNILK